MSLLLLSDHVAVIPLEDPLYREDSGLWIAEEARQKIDQGIVKYRGPATMDIRVGDHVFFSGYNGTKITVDGEGVFIILSEEDVDAVWDEPPQKMFPIKLVDRLLEEARGDALSRAEFQTKAVDHLFQLIRSKFNDYEMEKGLEF